MKRVLLICCAVLVSLAAPASAINRGISGLWYNPAQPGHGFEITIVGPSTAAVTWYTYNASGAPVWVGGVLTETLPGVLSGNVDYYQGMRFGSFVPSQNQSFPWGTLRFAFTGCSVGAVEYNGTLRYQDGTGFGSGSMALVKLAGVQDLGCGAPAPASIAGAYSGVIGSSDSSARLDAVALLEANGSVTLMVPGNSAYFGSYSISGSTVALDLTGQTVAGLVFGNGASTSTSTATANTRPGDYISGSYSGASGSGTFTLAYLGLSTRTPALSDLAGTYADATGDTTFAVTINSTGGISGQDAGGCRFSGSLSIPDATLNAYNVNVTATNCGPGNGNYIGKAVRDDADAFGDGRGLAIAVRGPSNAVTAFLRRN